MCAKYKCRICGDKFDSKSECLNHVEREHKEFGERACVRLKYRCPVCGDKFEEEGECKAHVREKHLGTSVRCDEVQG